MKTQPQLPYINPNLRHVSFYVHGEFASDLEHPSGESMTVPDMTMSMAELIDRHTRGLPIPQFDNPQYSEHEIPDLDRMDLAQIQQLSEDNKQYILDLQAEQKLIEADLKARQSPLVKPDDPIV